MPQRSLAVSVLLILCLLSQPLWAGDTRKMVILGDSLSAGYGIAEDEAWVSLLQERLAEQRPDWQAVNASTSGETTGGGLRRIDKLLDEQQPDLMVIQLGGNDGLRGFPHQDIRNNLAQMIERSKAAGAEVMLLGIELPPNYGRRYTEVFARQYHELADDYDVTLVPFMLEDIYDRNGMMQSDDIHPTAAAQPLILDNVWEQLEDLL